MREWIIRISRWFLGTLLILSGLIKANDTMGFAFKLEEYFASDVLDIPALMPAAWLLATLACLGEIVLGYAILTGYKKKLAQWSTFALLVFFAFLTFYSAYFNKVTDCGCFGDAIKFTPWESFIKDVVLLFFNIILITQMKFLKVNDQKEDLLLGVMSFGFVAVFSIVQLKWYFPILFFLIVAAGIYLLKYKFNNKLGEEKLPWAIVGYVSAVVMAFALHTLYHLPIKDYRPYSVGDSIVEGMKSAEELGLQSPSFGYIYTMKNLTTGEEVQISNHQYMDEKWWEDTNYEMLGDKTIQFKEVEGYEPPIHDFVLEHAFTGNNVTDSLLNLEVAYMVISYDIETVDTKVQDKVNAFAEQANKDGVFVMGATGAMVESVENHQNLYHNPFDYYLCDGTALKTIIRSNPGLVRLENGVVTGKWSAFDWPEYEAVK